MEIKVSPEGTQFIPRAILLTNDTYGRQMAQDATTAGSSETIHNGGDSTEWTGSVIVGSSIDFASTTQAYAGSASVEIDNPSVGDTWQFDKGSAVSLTGKDTLTGKVWIDSNWAAGDSLAIYAWDTGTGLVVGNQVVLEGFINIGTFGAWQSFSIPLDDLGLSGSSVFDSFRMTQDAKHSQSPTWYLDDFTLSEASTITFEAGPEEGKVVYYNRIEFTFVDDVTGGMSYEGFLGVTGETFTIQRFEEGIPQVGVVVGGIGELLSFTYEITSVMDDGVNTLVKVVGILEEPAVLHAIHSDVLTVTINGDFSGLTSMTALIIGKEEI